MKLWVDDGRKEPEGWARARDLKQAQAYLSAYTIEEISLDHDLGRWGTGVDLVLWMIDRDLIPEQITIHSWNAVGARTMAQALNDAGVDCEVRPFSAEASPPKPPPSPGPPPVKP